MQDVASAGDAQEAEEEEEAKEEFMDKLAARLRQKLAERSDLDGATLGKQGGVTLSNARAATAARPPAVGAKPSMLSMSGCPRVVPRTSTISEAQVLLGSDAG